MLVALRQKLSDAIEALDAYQSSENVLDYEHRQTA